MLWIGLTGPMGSGKSTVAELLRQMGFTVLDADLLARQILDPGTEGERDVFKTFGESVRSPEGTLDRRALGRIVFADPKKLAQLERLVHPRVQKEVTRRKLQLALEGQKVAFYDVPLLFEKRLQDVFDRILVVSAPASVRVERLQRRSQLTPAEIEARSHHHVDAEIKERAAHAVIRNDGDLAHLRAQLSLALLQLKIDLPAAAHT